MAFYSSFNLSALKEILVVSGMFVSRRLTIHLNTKIPSWSNPPQLITYFHIEKYALLGYYATNRGNSLPTFWDNITVPSAKVKSPKSSALIQPSRLSCHNLGLLHSSLSYIPLLLIQTVLFTSSVFAFHRPVFFPTYLTRRTSGHYLVTSRFVKSSVSFLLNKCSVLLIRWYFILYQCLHHHNQ
jgi:hypothetical protein